MLRGKCSRFSVAVALITVLGIVAPAAALAAGPSGASPADAVAPAGAQEELAVGQQRWYVFHTGGDNQNGDPSKVTVSLAATPGGSAQFSVWTLERLQQDATKSQDDKLGPIGQGTTVVKGETNAGDDWVLYGGDLMWFSRFKIGDTLYVCVSQTGPSASKYTLAITGDSVSFPTAAAAPAATAAPAAGAAAAAPTAVAAATAPQAPATPAAAAPASKPAAAPSAAVASSAAVTKTVGTGPDTAGPVTGDWVKLAPGQQHWYAIRATGKWNQDDKPHLFVDLKSQPGNSAKLTIWNQERLRREAVDNPNDRPGPVGRGVQAIRKEGDFNWDLYGGDLIWQGDASVPGTFYLVVEANGTTPFEYKLTVDETHS